MEELKGKRKQLKTKLTRFGSFVENYNSQHLEEIKLRLEKIEEVWESFDTIQTNIELIDEAEEAYRNNFEGIYYETVSRARKIVSEQANLNASDSANTHVTQTSNNGIKVKLPTINLPIFNGNYSEWLMFSDSFMSIIEKNESLSEIQKFQYLRGSLRHEPLQVIQSLETTDENYKVAWNLLKARYENVQLIINTHLQHLFDIPSITKESYTNLRHLIDIIRTNTNALQTLKEPVEKWDTILIYLFNNKLDWKTRQLWQEKVAVLNSTNRPTLNYFLEFLSMRSQSLEMAQGTSKNEIHKSFPSKRNMSFSSTTAPTCEYCKGQHYLFKCDKFLELLPQKRFIETQRLGICLNCLKNGHFVKQCRSGTSCKKCDKRHNTLLHRDNNHDTVKENNECKQKDSTALVNHSSQSGSHHVFLPTAVILVCDKRGNMHEARALLDSGSQSNFITQSLLEKLCLTPQKLDMAIYGVNNKMTQVKDTVQVKIQSRINGFHANMNCLVLEKITQSIPYININIKSLELPADLKLADENFNISSPIDLLIGSEIFWKILSVGQIKLGKGKPVLQKTVFGWTVTGAISCTRSLPTFSHLSLESSVQAQLEKFWKLEDVSEDRMFTTEELTCEEYFKKTIQRNEQGRFIVGLPKKEGIQLGNSLQSVKRRFNYLERRLANNDDLRKEYEVFMKKYEDLDHMTKIGNLEEKQTEASCYLPHHPVIKEESVTTKVRVVFDASHKTDLGTSLNDILLIGPVIQDDLFDIVIRFRTYEYVLTADIAMMYRQILIRPQDRHLQRILWRNDIKGPIQIFNLNTVTYGTSSAPYLATRCLKQLAEEDGDNFGLAKPVLMKDFYMDDVLTGSNTKEEAIELQKQLSELLACGGFELRKWRTNEQDILKHLTREENSNDFLVLQSQESMKVLGLLWNSSTDILTYNIKANYQTKVNKRNILSQIAQIFDPLGMISPVIVTAKCIMQKLWQLKLTWEESVPQEIYAEWLKFRDSLTTLNSLLVPRNVNLKNKSNFMEIHGFCDASIMAYGACIYVRSYRDNIYQTNLLCAKSRVAPLKTISLPRLELCGANLLAKLISRVKRSLTSRIKNIYLWSDSTIVLAWIKTDPNRLKVFVANRVTEIQNRTNGCRWNHVSSTDNPADVISRGATVEQLMTNTLWWNGPKWLEQEQLPIKDLPEIPISELKSNVILFTCQGEFKFLTKYSNWSKLQRVLAYCLRFVKNCKRNTIKIYDELEVSELNSATEIIIRMVQEESFPREIRALRRGQTLNSKSQLLSLNPFADKMGLIRVGGRLQNANILPDEKHPLILPAKHHVTNLIFTHEHIKNHHCGPEHLLSLVRTRFWPISGRQCAKRIVHICHQCFRFNPKHAEHIMGNLPSSRVSDFDKPFTKCGIDFAGPIQVKEHKRRGRVRITKGYMGIFVCFNIKAVHIELVSDLTTEAFLAALRRFVARRGICKQIYSDNATTFVGANRQLKEIYTFLKTEESYIKRELANRQIEWKFIPPRAPHMGGLWESAVKATKRHFYKVTQNLTLTFEECCTLLAEIEAVLNSRPLVSISSNPNDYSALTPSHLLIGQAHLEPIDHLNDNGHDKRISRWQHLTNIKHHFWNRWRHEYLQHLQQRTKWKASTSNLTVGTLVLLIEDGTPPVRWPLGRIAEIYPGQDGVVRVVLVRTAHGVYKRPTRKVCVLPSDLES